MRLSQEQKQKWKHVLSTATFIAGVLFDNLTLGRVDHLLGIGWLLGYIVVSGILLALLYAAAADRLPETFGRFVKTYAPYMSQFALGGLLSGTLVFYSRGGSWSVSWPFLALVLGIMIANEMVHDRIQRLLFNLTIFFLGIFSFLVLFVPIFVKSMNPFVFVLSGALSLICMWLYVKLLRRIIPRFIEHHLRSIVFTIGMIFSLLNFLYFMNIIPPIPLSLLSIDVYHSVVHIDTAYVRMYEKAPWYKFWREADTTYHRRAGEPVYCFASVFAPTAFSLDIYHRWERYDEIKKKWVTLTRIPYHIEGGNDDGYRGFTYLQNAEDGAWRCNVETKRGQVIGRESFRIVSGEAGELTTRTE